MLRIKFLAALDTFAFFWKTRRAMMEVFVAQFRAASKSPLGPEAERLRRAKDVIEKAVVDLDRLAEEGSERAGGFLEQPGGGLVTGEACGPPIAQGLTLGIHGDTSRSPRGIHVRKDGTVDVQFD